MGNRPTRTKSTSDVPPGTKRRKKSSKNGDTKDPNKHTSMPELGGAIPYRSTSRDDTKGRDVSVTIYRSYRDLGRKKAPYFKDGNEPVDFKFYRRSARFPNTIEKPSTLPRNFGRSKSAAYPDRTSLTPNGDVPSFATLPPKEGLLRSGRSSTRSSRGRSRTSSANSTGRMSVPVMPSDFPATDDIKRKLALYEELFIKSLLSRFTALPTETQLNAVILAIDTTENNRYVSLQEYLQADEETIPANLTTDGTLGRYALTIPPAFLHGLSHVRRDKIADSTLWVSQARDLVTCVGTEAANELTRIYEYQIVLMFDDVAMRIIAEHAAECVMEHVQNHHFIDRNSAIFSVVNTYPVNEDGAAKFISGVVGTKELKWDLYELYKKPGLRKELNLQTDEFLNDSGIESPGLEFQPWQFYFSENSQPFLYGYRGQTIEWDYINARYKLDTQEDQRFSQEIAFQPEDFHRLYMPYKRLVGYEVMHTYCNKPMEGERKETLAETIKTDIIEGPKERDEIQPVYRPLSSHTNGINYDKAVLDNVDLTRANMKDADLSETRAQNATLLLADLDIENLENSNLDGADISYSSVQARELSPNSLKTVKARHVSLIETGDAMEGDPELLNSPDSLPSPKSPGRSPGLNTSFISDGDGKVFTIPEAVEQQAARAKQEEEERRRAAEEEAAQKAAEHEKRVLVVREKLKDGSDTPDGARPVLRKKKKSRKKRVDEVAEFMNQSVDSAHSATDANILDEKPLRSLPSPVTSTQPTFQPEPQPVSLPSYGLSEQPVQQAYQPPPPQHPPPEQSYKPAPRASAEGTNVDELIDAMNGFTTTAGYSNGERHNRSMDNVLDYSHTMPANSRYDYHNRSEELLSEPKSATMTYSAATPVSIHNTSLPSSDYPGNGDKPPNDVQRNPIQSRYSTGERRPQRLTPRMVKSHSHHGHLIGAGKGLSIDAYGMGSLSGRRMLSQTELEYLRRSQIFTLLKGLTIENVDPALPPLCDPFLGRKEEKFDIADLISASGRIITLTGCPGIGKSNLAIAVANELIKKFVCPVYIDCRSCKTVEGVRQKLMHSFGVFFKDDEMDYFYNWINSHEQRMLFLFDNLELNEALNGNLSAFVDSLLFHVKNLRILSTSEHQFFRGQAMHETYRVGDIRDYSDMIVEMLVPDLHEEGKLALITAADHILFGVYLAGKAFSIANVDAGKLFEDLSTPGSNGINVNRLQDAIYNFTTNELEQERLFKLAVLVRKVLEHVPSEVVDLLNILSKVPGDFDMATAVALSPVDSEAMQDYIDELVNLELLLKTNSRYMLPFVVKLVLESCWPDNGNNKTKVVSHFVDKLKIMTKQFNSVDCFPATEQSRADYTNLVCLLRWLVEHEDTYDYCMEFANLDYAMFLCEFLPQSLYEDLYESLGQQAEDQDDVVTKTNAICCLAYRCMMDEKYSEGKSHAESAYDCLHAAQISEKHKAFCILCLGKAYWVDEDTKVKGLALIKSALDIYKQYYTLKDPKAIFANEEYGRLLAEKNSHQTARHIFNLSDLVMKEIVDKHPLLIQSYDQRRAIWDKLFLFGRATDISQKAVDVSKQFYGDHPITADMLVRLCECIMKRGSLQDGIQTCIEALRIRIKVLGDHKDTALSYKTLAYLMLRSGQYDEAIRFAQCALEIHEKIESKEGYKIDVRNIMMQARSRLEARSSMYLDLDSSKGSKTHIADLHNQSCIASFSTEV